jgi:methylthioribulose 1-phosphate dehydratase/enolase-phosphatase E1
MLADQLEVALAKYPKCNAVLVRRHGVFVWGDSWEQAKTQMESFDYLFQAVVELRKIGVDFSEKPRNGTYRVDDEKEPCSKRQKTGFNGISNVNNAEDLTSNKIPILPRDAKHLLLDIEGCTTSISFVKDTLFPFVLKGSDAFLNAMNPTEYNTLAESLRSDLTPEQTSQISDTKDCASMIRFMVEHDLKLASLKSLQGKMWKDGYERGSLKGHVYPDLIPMLQWMKS